MLTLALLETFLANTPTICRIYVAFSGGMDSTVLLHQLATTPAFQGYHLFAIHINHGISSHARAWDQWCETQAQRWGVTYASHTLQLKKHKGESLEQVAREARYDIFLDYLDSQSVLLTAHHQNDQAETMLLQLLRGAGLKGLAAMPVVAAFGESWHVRPFLNQERCVLEAYAADHDLEWIEDESNEDRHYDRNYLRHEIIPLLLQRWPAAMTTIARSAMHCASANQWLEQQAALDWQQVRVEEALSLAGLAMLPLERQQQVIRYALQRQSSQGISYDKTLEILHVMFSAKQDATPLVAWPGGEARRYQGLLYLLKPRVVCRESMTLPVRVGHDAVLPLHGESLAWTQQLGGLHYPRDASLQIRYRQGSERFHPVGRSGSHPLKKLMQEWNIPPWLRDHIPLLYDDEQLIAVVGYGIAEEAACQDDAMGWMPLHLTR
jgi:tRNA(Ile)-lysidine synthase